MGAFSRDFTTSLAPDCRAFSGALNIEKIIAPLIPGPEGAVDTNDWCITQIYNNILTEYCYISINCHKIILFKSLNVTSNVSQLVVNPRRTDKVDIRKIVFVNSP